MGRVGYDWLQGMARVAEASAGLNPLWAEVIALHAAIEVEVNAMLEKCLRRSDAVLRGSPALTFGHKVNLLKAVWEGDPEAADQLCEVLRAFNELRNSVAHPDRKKTKAELRNVKAGYKALVPGLEHDPELSEVAQGVCAFMGDGLAPHDMVNMLERLAILVNDNAPNVDAVSGDEAVRS